MAFQNLSEQTDATHKCCCKNSNEMRRKKREDHVTPILTETASLASCSEIDLP